MAPLPVSCLLGRSSRTAPAALPVLSALPLLLAGGAFFADGARPEGGVQAAAKLKQDAMDGKFDPKRFDTVGKKADEIKAAVDGLENGAKRSESKAEDVKAKFNQYTKEIRTLHSQLNELMVKRHEYAKELFTYIRDTENHRLEPLLAQGETVGEQPTFQRSAMDAKPLGEASASALQKNSPGPQEGSSVSSSSSSSGAVRKANAKSKPSSLEEASESPQEGSSTSSGKLEEAGSKTIAAGVAGGGPQEAS